MSLPEKERSQLNRRDFLRLGLLSAAGAALAACEPGTPSPTAVPLPSATPTPPPGGQIQLNGSSDAWTWKKVISGRLENAIDCKSLVVNVNGMDFEASLSDQPASTGGAAFSAEIPLTEGENRVIAICLRMDGQEKHSELNQIRERLRHTPTANINIIVDGDQIVLDSSTSQVAEENGPALIDYLWSPRPGNPAPLMAHGVGKMIDRELSGDVSEQAISLNHPTVDGEYYVRLRVKDEEGREDTSTSYFVVENGQARVPNYGKENPVWVESAVVYGVIPFLFGNPAFKAVTNRLDYLADLGVNAVWLAPVNVSPPDDYGYAVADYFNLNSGYGTKVEFHRLVQEAHARGIRVLMDFVPNHSSDQHPYFVDTQERGEDSPYWDFYDRDEQGHYTYYFDWTNLPNLNYDNPEVQRMMIEAFSYWVREFDVDGFRVDAAWAVTKRHPDFWPEWRKALKRIKPDLLLLAEASARDPFYFSNGFDAAYDWTGQVGQGAWEIVWKSYQNRQLAYNLQQALTNRPDGYDPDALIFRFLNNNDTGERFITKFGSGLSWVATALLLTLPGIPCVYTGDEIGAEFEPYQALTPIAWNEQVHGLRDYHKKLIQLRKDIPSLHSRLWTPLKLEAAQNVFGYVRYGKPTDAPVIVLLNFSEEPAEIQFDVLEGFGALSQRNKLYDLLAEENVSVTADGRMQVSVPATTARILAEAPIK